MRLRFSISQLLALILWAGVCLAILLYSSDVALMVVRSFACASFIAAVCSCFATRETWRRRSLAYLGGAWMYLAFVYVVCGGFERHTRSLITTIAAEGLWMMIRVPDKAFDPTMTPLGGASPSFVPEWYQFFEVSSMLTAINIGLAVALIAEAIHWKPLGGASDRPGESAG